MSKRDSQHGDRGVDWDADARRAAAAPYPYTEHSFFNYFKNLVKPNDRVLEVGCQIASWIWAWRGTEPTVRYEGLDWSLPALTIARDRYGENGGHVSTVSLADIIKITKKPKPTKTTLTLYVESGPTSRILDWDPPPTPPYYEPFNIERKIIGAPAKFHHMDAREIPFEDEFDIVFSHTFFQHTNLETKQIVAPRVAKALKPGGLLIIQENTSGDSTWGWMKQGWIDFFSTYGFKFVRAHDIPGGGTGFVFKN